MSPSLPLCKEKPDANIAASGTAMVLTSADKGLDLDSIG
jgi:hypothetical protein